MPEEQEQEQQLVEALSEELARAARKVEALLDEAPEDLPPLMPEGA